MRFLPGNAQHVGSRHSQQDSFGFGDPEDREFVAHGGFLAVVCDGMGGMEYGDAASRTAVRAFLDAYRRKTAEESIPNALNRSVHAANQQVVSLAHRLGLAEGIGTTLVAAALQERSLYFISVGDSGLFVTRGGSVRMVNHPHVFANILDAAVERGAMSREEALAHPERESLTSFIGAESLREIDRNLDPFPLLEGDTILLASDGMFKTLAAEEIAASLEGNPQAWPEVLVERTLAKKREFQDNVTVLSVTAAADEFPALPRTAASGGKRNSAIPPAPASMLEPPLLSTSEWPAPVEQKAPVPQAPRAGRHGAMWAVIVVLILVVAAGGWWFARRAPAQGKRSAPASSSSASQIPAPGSGAAKGRPQ